MSENIKIKVLEKIAQVFNREGVVWAVGGSLLLYLNNMTDSFNDIDLMVDEEQVEKVKKALASMGELQPEKPKNNFKTRYFLEYNIDGVEVDIMAGLTILKDNLYYYCPLKKEDIKETIELGMEYIPLHSVAKWEEYYKLMDRQDKLNIIKNNSKHIF